MRPTPRLAGAVALAVVVYFYGSTSQVAWLFLAAYLILALALAGFLYALRNARALCAAISVSGARPGPGSPIDLLHEGHLRTAPLPAPIFEADTVTVRLAIHGDRHPRGPARLIGLLAGQVVEVATGVVPAQGWHADRDLGPISRGPIRAEGWVLETGDPTGFFSHRAAHPSAEVALVLPRFASLRERPRQRELEASAAAPRAGAGSELFGVREYSSGDALRRIHWRSSARRGELVVREYEPPGLQTLVVVLDPAPPSPEVADQIARLAASETWDCLRDGGRVVAWCPGREATHADEARSLWAILDWLARYPELPVTDFEPRFMSDAVAIVARSDSPALEAVVEVRRRGGAGRAWLVGEPPAGGADDAEDPDTEVPTRRVGLVWPL